VSERAYASSVTRDGACMKPALYREDVKVILEALDLLQPIATRENIYALHRSDPKQVEFRERIQAVMRVQGELSHLLVVADAREAGQPVRAYTITGARSPWHGKKKKRGKR
jgi:hypothetical protein